MAITYNASTFNSAGTHLGGNVYYKDVTVSCATGDLLVAFGVGETANTSGDPGVVTTQSGSTSAWTTRFEHHSSSSDVGFVIATATVSSGTSVTARIGVSAANSSARVGGGVFVIAAADWTGTPALGFSITNDADGQGSATLSATSIVLYAAGDWSATNPGTTGTPSGGTNRTSYFDTTNYSAFAHSWTGQASGTRNYGPSGLSGKDFSGALIVVQEVSGAYNGTSSIPLAVGVTAAGVVGKSATTSRAQTVIITSSGSAGKSTGASIPLAVGITAAGSVGTVYTGDSSIAETVTVASAGNVGTSSGATVPLAVGITAAGSVAIHYVKTVNDSVGITDTDVNQTLDYGVDADPITETVTVSSAGNVATSSGSTITGTVAVTAAGEVTGSFSGDASIDQAVTITAAGVVDRNAAATVPLTNTVTAAGNMAASTGTTVPLAATITAAGTVAAAGEGQVAVSETATITAAGNMAANSGATVAQTFGVTATGVVSAGVTVTETVAITAAGDVAGDNTAAVPLAATVTAAGTVATSAGASIGLAVTITGAIGERNITVTGSLRAPRITGTLRPPRITGSIR